jgi:hypothetical protein
VSSSAFALLEKSIFQTLDEWFSLISYTCNNLDIH